MLSFLRRITQEMMTASNLDEALSLVVMRVCETMGVEACAIYLNEPEGGYVLHAAYGFEKGCTSDLALVEWVGTHGEPLNLDNAKADLSRTSCYQAFLGAPIIHQRKLLGVLVAQQRAQRKFDENEESFLITVAAQLGGIIAQSQAEMQSFQEAVKTHKRAEVQGIPGAPGVALGKVVRVFASAHLEDVPDREIEDIESECDFFLQMLQQTREEIRDLSLRIQGQWTDEEQLLFDAYIKILDNTALGEEVVAVIREQKQWAQGALRTVVMQHLIQFSDMEDPYLRERAMDLKDLGVRVLSHLQSKQKVLLEYPEQTILVGEEVTAAHLAEVPANRLAGIVCVQGSANSHVAILARAMGIPTVMGASNLPLSGIENQTLIVDGYHGMVHLAPSKTVRAEFLRLMQEEKTLYANLEALQHEPAVTPDGHPILLLANAGLMADIPSSLDVGAQGVGLYRTEVPFMVRDRFPSEEEQRQIYRKILQAFAPRPVIMRTLDIGGDKVLPYFQIEEQNPFLGWRGLRVTLDHPEIFLVQVRAMLRASSGLNNLRIMLPMVSSIQEIREAQGLLVQAYEELHAEDPFIAKPELGVMIEVPSAVYQAELFASECDFLSVGSNDLVQYLLAVDRNNARVSNLYDAFHPAVIKALMDIVSAAHSQGKPASVCGELASDPLGVLLLLAMGYDSLSMNATSLSRVKWVIRSFSLLKAQALLSEVLALDDAAAIRQVLQTALIEAGLGGLVRAGG